VGAPPLSQYVALGGETKVGQRFQPVSVAWERVGKCASGKVTAANEGKRVRARVNPPAGLRIR